MMKSSRREFVSISAAAAVLTASRVARAGASASGEPPLDEAASGKNTSAPAVDSLAAKDLIAPTRAVLDSRRSPVLTPFLADWPTTGERRPVVPTTIPVLRLLPKIEAAAPAFSRTLVSDIARAAPNMAWNRTYSEALVGAEFLQNYGYSEIMGTGGTVPSEHVACGFLLLGPNTYYPPHQHEAEEVYIPLSGTAEWMKGKSGWHKRTPGTVIHHASNEPHSMRTGASPFLGLYLWRSTNLRQQAHFVS
jgi:hypothetical protein